MKKSFISMLILVMILATACSGAKFEGEWESVYVKEGDQYYYFTDNVNLELKSDQTMEAEIFEQDIRGTWEKDGNGVAITLEGEKAKAVLENEFLILSDPKEDKLFYFVRDADMFNKFPEGIKHY